MCKATKKFTREAKKKSAPGGGGIGSEKTLKRPSVYKENVIQAEVASRRMKPNPGGYHPIK
jgi:hypothetical protein